MDVHRLIEEVRLRPLLWDRTQCNYRPKARLQKLWQEISEVLNQPTEVCIHKWTKLREHHYAFLRRYEKHKLRGIQEQYNSKWPYIKEMRFIEKNRRSYDNDNNKGRRFTEEHDQSTNSTDDTYGSQTCSTSEIKIEPTRLDDHETYLHHRESDADDEDFELESDEIMLEEFQSIVSPHEPSQEPEVTTPKKIFTAAKFSNAISTSAGYHQIKVATPPPNHMSAVVSRTLDEKTSEESTTNDGQCSSNRLDFEPHEILLEEFQSIVSAQDPSQELEVIASQGIYTADKFPTITSTNAGYHQIIVTPPASTHQPADVPRTSVEKTSEHLPTNDGHCFSKRSEKHVNSPANFEEEEQQLTESTQKAIKESTDYSGNPNYNFLISFLPQMDNMTYLQNLRFRARMSELVLNIFEPNGEC